ncbi:hypothetical protein B566_EDAN004186 [Ephemera danica]|nr:hypothetical protein B566_EDAN004186 [Ephemera danica]
MMRRSQRLAVTKGGNEPPKVTSNPRKRKQDPPQDSGPKTRARPRTESPSSSDVQLNSEFVVLDECSSESSNAATSSMDTSDFIVLDSVDCDVVEESVDKRQSPRKATPVNKPTPVRRTRQTAAKGNANQQSSSTEAVAKQPPSTGTTAKQPPSIGTTAKQPPSTETTAKQPPSTGITAKQPLNAGAITKQPSSTGTTAKQPSKTGAVTEQPPDTETTAKQPPSTVTVTKEAGKQPSKSSIVQPCFIDILKNQDEKIKKLIEQSIDLNKDILTEQGSKQSASVVTSLKQAGKQLSSTASTSSTVTVAKQPSNAGSVAKQVDKQPPSTGTIAKQPESKETTVKQANKQPPSTAPTGTVTKQPESKETTLKQPSSTETTAKQPSSVGTAAKQPSTVTQQSATTVVEKQPTKSNDKEILKDQDETIRNLIEQSLDKIHANKEETAMKAITPSKVGNSSPSDNAGVSVFTKSQTITEKKCAILAYEWLAIELKRQRAFVIAELKARNNIQFNEDLSRYLREKIKFLEDFAVNARIQADKKDTKGNHPKRQVVITLYKNLKSDLKDQFQAALQAYKFRNWSANIETHGFVEFLQTRVTPPGLQVPVNQKHFVPMSQDPPTMPQAYFDPASYPPGWQQSFKQPDGQWDNCDPFNVRRSMSHLPTQNVSIQSSVQVSYTYNEMKPIPDNPKKTESMNWQDVSKHIDEYILSVRHLPRKQRNRLIKQYREQLLTYYRQELEKSGTECKYQRIVPAITNTNLISLGPHPSTGSATKPAATTQSATKPAETTQSASKPATQSAIKSTTPTQSAIKPTTTTQSATKSVTTTQSATEPATTTQSATKPATTTQSATKPATTTQSATKRTTGITGVHRFIGSLGPTPQKVNKPSTITSQSTTKPTTTEQSSTKPMDVSMGSEEFIILDEDEGSESGESSDEAAANSKRISQEEISQQIKSLVNLISPKKTKEAVSIETKSSKDDESSPMEIDTVQKTSNQQGADSVEAISSANKKDDKSTHMEIDTVQKTSTQQEAVYIEASSSTMKKDDTSTPMEIDTVQKAPAEILQVDLTVSPEKPKEDEQKDWDTASIDSEHFLVIDECDMTDDKIENDEDTVKESVVEEKSTEKEKVDTEKSSQDKESGIDNKDKSVTAETEKSVVQVNEKEKSTAETEKNEKSTPENNEKSVPEIEAKDKPGPQEKEKEALVAEVQEKELVPEKSIKEKSSQGKKSGNEEKEPSVSEDKETEKPVDKEKLGTEVQEKELVSEKSIKEKSAQGKASENEEKEPPVSEDKETKKPVDKEKLGTEVQEKELVPEKSTKEKSAQGKESVNEEKEQSFSEDKETEKPVGEEKSGTEVQEKDKSVTEVTTNEKSAPQDEDVSEIMEISVTENMTEEKSVSQVEKASAVDTTNEKSTADKVTGDMEKSSAAEKEKLVSDSKEKSVLETTKEKSTNDDDTEKAVAENNEKESTVTEKAIKDKSAPLDKDKDKEKLGPQEKEKEKTATENKEKEKSDIENKSVTEEKEKSGKTPLKLIKTVPRQPTKNPNLPISGKKIIQLHALPPSGSTPTTTSPVSTATDAQVTTKSVPDVPQSTEKTVVEDVPIIDLTDEPEEIVPDEQDETITKLKTLIDNLESLKNIDSDNHENLVKLHAELKSKSESNEEYAKQAERLHCILQKIEAKKLESAKKSLDDYVSSWTTQVDDATGMIKTIPVPEEQQKQKKNRSSLKSRKRMAKINSRRQSDRDAERAKRLVFEKEKARQIEYDKEKARKLEMVKEKAKQINLDIERVNRLEAERDRIKKAEEAKERARKLEAEKEKARKLAVEREKARKIEEAKEKARKLTEDYERQRKLEEDREKARKLAAEGERLRQLELERERARKIEEDRERAKKIQFERDRARKLELDRQAAQYAELEQKRHSVSARDRERLLEWEKMELDRQVAKQMSELSASKNYAAATAWPKPMLSHYDDDKDKSGQVTVIRKNMLDASGAEVKMTVTMERSQPKTQVEDPTENITETDLQLLKLLKQALKPESEKKEQSIEMKLLSTLKQAVALTRQEPTKRLRTPSPPRLRNDDLRYAEKRMRSESDYPESPPSYRDRGSQEKRSWSESSSSRGRNDSQNDEWSRRFKRIDFPDDDDSMYDPEEPTDTTTSRNKGGWLQDLENSIVEPSPLQKTLARMRQLRPNFDDREEREHSRRVESAPVLPQSIVKSAGIESAITSIDKNLIKKVLDTNQRPGRVMLDSSSRPEATYTSDPRKARLEASSSMEKTRLSDSLLSTARFSESIGTSGSRFSERFAESFTSSSIDKSRYSDPFGSNLSRFSESLGPSGMDKPRFSESLGPSGMDKPRFSESLGPSGMDKPRFSESMGPSRFSESFGPSGMDKSRFSESFGPSGMDKPRFSESLGPSGMDKPRFSESLGPSAMGSSRLSESIGSMGPKYWSNSDGLTVLTKYWLNRELSKY